jgi:rhamnose utilization protein RhaD (predicted bifunctional aldolase and dehydrogenase)
MIDRHALLDLCHELGDPARDLVLSGEGNVSIRLGEERMLIKASGCSLRTMTADDLLEVDRHVILGLVSGADVTDDETARVYRQSIVREDESGRMPSVEAILHAVIYEETAVGVVAHTHPVAVNALLCSTSPELLVGGALFPDQIVALGRHQLLVPYTDPGVPLAAAVRAALRGFAEQHGEPPRVVYLVNHGVFVLAGTPAEALHVTEMTVKVARVLLGTLAAGGPAFLADDNVDRIDRRPDEHYRRSRLTHGAEEI